MNRLQIWKLEASSGKIMKIRDILARTLRPGRKKKAGATTWLSPASRMRRPNEKPKRLMRTRVSEKRMRTIGLLTVFLLVDQVFCQAPQDTLKKRVLLQRTDR